MVAEASSEAFDEPQVSAVGQLLEDCRELAQYSVVEVLVGMHELAVAESGEEASWVNPKTYYRWVHGQRQPLPRNARHLCTVLNIGKGAYRKASRADRKAKKNGLILVGPTTALIALLSLWGVCELLP